MTGMNGFRLLPRLVAVLTAGVMLLPFAASALCSFDAARPMDGMDQQAMQHESNTAQATWTEPGSAPGCVTFTHCIASQLGFSVARSSFEARAQLAASDSLLLPTVLSGHILAPPTPPPRA